MNVDFSGPGLPRVYAAGSHSEVERASELERARSIRDQVVSESEETIRHSPSPIRAMARMVIEVTRAMHEAGISQAVIEKQVINRTIGDVDVRRIREREPGASPGSLGDYSTIGEDLGLILPGESLNGMLSEGRGYEEMRRRMTGVERRLLRDYQFDVRMYDVYGVGNPLLRSMLAESWQQLYGLPLKTERTFVSIGALDGLDKTIRTLKLYFGRQYAEQPAICFPSPGFAVVLWQAQANDVEVINYATREEQSFKLTGAEMSRLLQEHANLRMLYLTVSNNPTAFDYEADELRAIFAAIAADGREMAILADTAYIGTGEPAADAERMRAFNTVIGGFDVLAHTIFVNSFSKICTLTGDRFGWVSTGNQQYADAMQVTWNNTMAGMPAEWQLRYTAMIDVLNERPWIQEKVRCLYRYRRAALRRELAAINAQHHVFASIGLDDDATIYNWSKLVPGEDVITLFRKTGLAAVDGSGFGYDKSYIRCSVGIHPAE